MNLMDNHISETLKHRKNVQEILNIMRGEMRLRGMMHDQSKLAKPEANLFAEVTPKLKGSTYGSDEYKEALKSIQPAINHHYEKNSHHPEHWTKGIKGMSLIDVLEMFADWWAASMRHDDGDIRRSVEINKERFDMSDELVAIFMNTIDELEEKVINK